MLSSHPWGAGKDRIFTTELQGKHHALILKSHMSREHLILSVCDSRYAQYLLIKLYLKIPYCSFSGSLPYFSPFLTSFPCSPLGAVTLSVSCHLSSATCTRVWETVHPLPCLESHPQGPVAQPVSESMPLASAFLLPPLPHLTELRI